MTPQRWRELELDINAKLTDQEKREGWHFCPDWDFMLLQVDEDGECTDESHRCRGGHDRS